MKMNFENLFPNDNRLSEVSNNLINENVQLFLEDIEPALEVSLSKSNLESYNYISVTHLFQYFSAKKFLKIINQIFDIAPLNDFFA